MAGILGDDKEAGEWLWTGRWWSGVDVPSQRRRRAQLVRCCAEQVGSRSFGPLLSAERLGRKGGSVGADPNPESGSPSAAGKTQSGRGFRNEWALDAVPCVAATGCVSIQEVQRGTGVYPTQSTCETLALADSTDKNPQRMLSMTQRWAGHSVTGPRDCWGQ